MPSDRSRRTDRPRHGYTGPVAQQGRVILDRDFNAGQGLTAARIAADALDFVGPCGTPDDGFLISLPGHSLPEPPLWSPPVTPPAESLPFALGGGLDFLIAPGTMYLGGERVEFPAEQDGRAITYSYFDQPDDPAPPPPSPDVVRELVYLDVTEQEVSAVEDPDLLEVALGGPDTTQRLKLLRRVRRMAVPAATCAAAWDVAVKRWAAEGWTFEPATMRLLPAARLRVGFTQDAAAADPCDPVATGGYLGADNQLIRVRLAGAAAAPTLLWGYDNASFLYPVTSVSPDGTTLTLAYDPPDALHVPQAKQVVEILQTAAVLATEPNETNPAGPQPLLRVVAEPNGTLRALAQPYGPATPGSSGNAIVLATALPASVARSTLPLFLRVWQAELSLTVGTAHALTDPVSGTSTGVTVTITSAGALADGAYWLIAVRPATPQGAYPEALLKSPQPPDGPRRWACPLGVIDWRAGTVTDCRSSFANLVTLTARRPGCCTVTIGPAEVTAATPLQALIDRAAAQAERVTVCLLAGTYTLPGSLRLDRRHTGITLEACGGPVLLQADATAAPARFADGLIVLAGTAAATLRGLSVPVPYAPTAYEKDLPGSYLGVGIRAVNAAALTLEDCSIECLDDAPRDVAYLLAAAVFLQGNCSGLTVRRCAFGGLVAPTFNAINTDDSNAAPARTTTGSRMLDRLVEPSATATPAAAAATPAAATPAAATPAAATPLSQAVERFTETLRPSSLPVAKATVLALRVKASEDVLVASRSAAAAQPKKPVIATAGVIAYDFIGGGNVADLDCQLGHAVIRDTVFSGLTFATLLAASANTLRLQDNTITGCVAGLWYLVPDATVPDSVADGTAGYYPQVAFFEEFLLLILLLELSAPPQSSAGTVVPDDTTTRILSAVATTDLALFIMGNQVDPTGSSNAAAGATAALFLALNGAKPTTAATVADLSTIVSGNQLRSACGQALPAALLTLPAAQACAITGNVIINIAAGKGEAERRGPIYGPSLWVTVADTAVTGGTALLSVTGNVLLDQSDLPVLTREGSSPPSGWFAFNANPT